jgi:hypothetical protein
LALFRLLEGGLSFWTGLAGRSARITSRPSRSAAGWRRSRMSQERRTPNQEPRPLHA